MEFNIDKFLTDKLGVTPLGAAGAYLGASTGSPIGIIAGTVIGNAINKPLGIMFLQLWDGMIGYRVQFWANKIKFDYDQEFQDYKNVKSANRSKETFVTESPSFVHALNLNKLRNKILNKIMNISPGKEKAPDLALIGPLLKDAEYYADSDVIREMYANLVAASANKDCEGKIHLAFASIIKQISPHDATLLMQLPHQKAIVSYRIRNHKDSNKYSIVYEDVYLSSKTAKYDPEDTLSIQNFERLGLIQVERQFGLSLDEVYDDYRGNILYRESEKFAKQKFGVDGFVDIAKESFEITKFGRLFREVCISQPCVEIHMEMKESEDEQKNNICTCAIFYNKYSRH